MTPRLLAEACVTALSPFGVVLEPCAGSGAFADAIRGCGHQVMTCEISDGSDFLTWGTKVNWIITNPPWSQFRSFLAHSMTVADDVAMLATVNHWWTKHRVRAVTGAGFGYRRLWLCEWPKDFPSSGFQLGLMHISRGWDGPLSIETLDWNRSQPAVKVVA